MRFHTRHLMGLVALVACVLVVVQHPQVLVGVLVPLVGWLLVVLPVLGTAEFLAQRSAGKTLIGWKVTALILVLGLIACAAAAVAALWALANLPG